MASVSRQLKEFRDFVMQGNIVALAVAVVLATAFGALITSFVSNLLTPLISIPGTTNFADLDFTIRDSVFRYGAVLNALISFVLIAAAVYFVVVRPLKALDARRHAGEEVDVTTRQCPECLNEVSKAARRCGYCTSQLTPVS